MRQLPARHPQSDLNSHFSIPGMPSVGNWSLSYCRKSWRKLCHCGSNIAGTVESRRGPLGGRTTRTWPSPRLQVHVLLPGQSMIERTSRRGSHPRGGDGLLAAPALKDLPPGLFHAGLNPTSSDVNAR
jgi:hypothetical protein